jgi:hypothetical protein
MRLRAGLLGGEFADDGQLEAFTLEGFEQQDDPDNQEPERNERHEDPADDGDQREDNVDGESRDTEEDRLPGMELDVRVPVVGLDDQEDDRRNDGDIGERAGSVVREATLRGGLRAGGLRRNGRVLR